MNIIKYDEVPCTVLEYITGRFFKCTLLELDEHIRNFNCLRSICNKRNIELNAWLEELGLTRIAIIGDCLKWDTWENIGDLDISYCSDLDDDGNPVIILEYNDLPKYIC